MSRKPLGPDEDSPMSCLAVLISVMVIVALIALALRAVIYSVDQITENVPAMYHGDAVD